MSLCIFVCACMCVCMYVNVFLYIYVCEHMCLCMHVYMVYIYVYAFMCLCMCMYVSACGARDQTRGFMYANQVFYQLNYFPTQKVFLALFLCLSQEI